MSAVSFYHLAGVDLDGRSCRGTACFVARHRDLARWEEAATSAPRVYCLGRCYAGPALADDTIEPHVEAATDVPVVLERLVNGPAPTIDDARRRGAYRALEQAVEMEPDAIVSELEASQLRGRGGAGFPTGRKWRAALTHEADRKYVVCNADEGDPGAYIDRVLLEQDPHAVLEGVVIAALAVGAARGYVYVRKEYPRASEVMRQAVEEARAVGILGARVLGHDRAFDVEVVDGEGSYLCGEETALLNAIEGRRPEVRARPPFPAQRGLFGLPTVVNNVETLANVGWIVRNGGAAYAAIGTGTSRGTKLVSLNSLFRRPGLYEVELGLPVRTIMDELGGGLETGPARGLLIGGPLAGVLPPHLFDTPFAFDELHAVGAAVGHGGFVAFDEHTTIPELVEHVFAFAAYESCGKCTPCRIGAADIERIVSDGLAAARSTPSGVETWRTTIAALAATSLCGHGTGLADFARSVETHYPEELATCFG